MSEQGKVVGDRSWSMRSQRIHLDDLNQTCLMMNDSKHWKSNSGNTRKHTFYLPMGPGGDRGWGRLTGGALLASACVCSLFGVVLSRGESLVLVIGNVSCLFCGSSISSSSPSADTPEDEGLDVCLCSPPVLLGVT